MAAAAHYLHSEESLRNELVATSRAVHARGWVANHDGNLSARLGGGRFLATPTAVSKGDVRPEWLIEVDAEGSVLHGTRSSFSEFQLHKAAYAARPDITVVIHAHPPCATAFAVSGAELGHPFMAEPVVTLGPVIPRAPYHRPKSPDNEAAVAAALRQADVVLLDRHGVLVVGGCFEQAFLRLELVEHLARIASAAASLGGVRPLPEAEVAALAAKGRPASWPERADATPVAPARPAVRPAPPPLAASGGGPRPDLEHLVRDALERLR